MGTPFDQTYGFSWSPASQLLTRTATNAAYKWATPTPGTTANAYDGLNRDAGLVTAGGYDARGNLTADGGRTFTYDVENRMLTAVNGATTVTFAYDPIGRLTTTAVPTATTFLHDSDRLSAEYSATGTLLRRYVHGPGVDEPLVWYEGATTSYPQFLHQDRQGSVIAWSDGSGTVSASTVYKYGPWGEPGDSWGAGSRFRYTGQIAIPEAKLYYYKARMYGPATGRFMQTDPIGYKDDLDLYAYVGGDPVNKVDPDGLAETDRVKSAETELQAFRKKDGAAMRAGAVDGAKRGLTGMLLKPITDQIPAPDPLKPLVALLPSAVVGEVRNRLTDLKKIAGRVARDIPGPGPIGVKAFAVTTAAGAVADRLVGAVVGAVGNNDLAGENRAQTAVWAARLGTHNPYDDQKK